MNLGEHLTSAFQSVGRRLSVVAFLVVLLVAGAARLRNIQQALPYSEHVDERTVVGLALTMLRRGDLNPHRFNYPSLPIYVILAGFVVGGTIAVLRGDARSLADLGSAAGHYYSVPFAAWFVKTMFAVLSVGSLAVVGIVSNVVTGRRATLWLAPLVACISYSYFRLSWSYLNVDILGAFFAVSTIGVLFARQPAAGRPTAPGKIPWRAVLAGALAGLTIGSKYNLFPILVPCITWFWFYDREHVTSRVSIMLVSAGVAFLLTTPFAVLDHREFLYGTLAEIRHYGLGKDRRGANHTFARGWPMFRQHVMHFADAFGWAPLAIGLGGFALLVRRDKRRAFILFSYPTGLVLFMSAQRLFFERNVVSVHLFIAIAIAEGILGIAELAAIHLAANAPHRKGRVQVALAVLTSGVVLLGAPWAEVKWAYDGHIEPRNEAVRWIRENLERDTTIVVDQELNLDLRTLGRFRTLEVTGAADALRAGPRGRTAVLVPERSAEEYLKTLPHSSVVGSFRRMSLVAATHGMDPSRAVSVVRF